MQMPTAKPLTKNQEAVLTQLRTADKPLSAYDILDHLSNSSIKAPQQIYRALTALIKYGYVHKVESLNVFVACTASKNEAHLHDDLIFLICRSCNTVTETRSTSLQKNCRRLAQSNDFEPELERIEVHGTCSICANA